MNNRINLAVSYTGKTDTRGSMMLITKFNSNGELAKDLLVIQYSGEEADNLMFQLSDGKSGKKFLFDTAEIKDEILKRLNGESV